MSFRRRMDEFDFGTTEIENIFISEFMPSADGLAVKVYLMGLRLTETGARSSLVDMALLLGVPLSDVIKAYEYWNSVGLVSMTRMAKEDYDIEYVSLRSLYLASNYERKGPKTSAGFGDFFKGLYTGIEEAIGRDIFEIDRQKIHRYLSSGDHDKEVVIAAFTEKKNTKRVVENSIKLLQYWTENGVTDMNTLDEFKTVANERMRTYRNILAALGHPYKNPTIGEKDTIDKWIDGFGLSEEDIIKQISETTKRMREPSMNYLNAIFTAKKDGVTIKHEKPVQKKRTQTKDKFHNYSGENYSHYSNEELEELLKKKGGN